MKNKIHLLILGIGIATFLITFLIFKENLFDFFLKEGETETPTIDLPPVKIVGENLVDKEIEKIFTYNEKTNTVYLKDKRLDEGVKFYMPFRGRVILRFEDLGRGFKEGEVYTYYFGIKNEEENYYIDIVGPLKPLVPYNFYVLEKGSPFAEVNYKGFANDETFPIYISISGKDEREAKEILKKLFPEIIK